ncbi:MAG: multicopper oxidase domain-containing protein [Actinobacteria bacterium]|nr:multicopper oxidase domain-containing protein [Actinomycetota bacterium]
MAADMMGGMGGMEEEMAHPMHVHGLQFQVLERQVRPEMAANWETVSAGYVDEGWKDTVLVMPGERVRLLLKFEDFTGLYLYHCHNLEHEDLGMMRNYRVTA